MLNDAYNNETEFTKENNRLKLMIDKFWNCFKEAIRVNKCGLDGKQRILSIITENFGFREIHNKLQVSFKYKVVSYFITTGTNLLQFFF